MLKVRADCEDFCGILRYLGLIIYSIVNKESLNTFYTKKWHGLICVLGWFSNSKCTGRESGIRRPGPRQLHSPGEREKMKILEQEAGMRMKTRDSERSVEPGGDGTEWMPRICRSAELLQVIGGDVPDLDGELDRELGRELLEEGTRHITQDRCTQFSPNLYCLTLKPCGQSSAMLYFPGITRGFLSQGLAG